MYGTWKSQNDRCIIKLCANQTGTISKRNSKGVLEGYYFFRFEIDSPNDKLINVSIVENLIVSQWYLSKIVKKLPIPCKMTITITVDDLMIADSNYNQVRRDVYKDSMLIDKDFSVAIDIPSKYHQNILISEFGH